MDSTGVSEECVMMCTELQCEDADEDVVVYGVKGLTQKSTKKLLMAIIQKPKAKKKMKLNIMSPKAQMTVCSWKGKEGDLIKVLLMKMHMA